MGACRRGTRAACAGLALVLALTPASAADFSFRCAGADGTPDADLAFAGEVLTVVEDGRTATLVGRVEGEPPENYGISAAGRGDAMLPEAAAMDACLDKGLKAQGATAADDDAVAYVVNGCRLDLAAVAQPADLSYQIIFMAPGPAQLFVTRTYATPSAVTGAPITVPEWPMRNCDPVR